MIILYLYLIIFPILSTDWKFGYFATDISTQNLHVVQ